MSFISDAALESKDYYENRVKKDIEHNRKGNFSVTVLKSGKNVQNAEISYKLKRHDFDFGSNIFMFDQYGNQQQQDTYLTQWKKIFNTAVLPLYWEGTEPQQGLLRYDADSCNDIYRRPPCGAVVEYCRENDIKMKGHPLFWQEFIPKWLPEKWDDLYPLIEKRFKEISERYANVIPVFDCVNEPSRLFDQHFEYRTNGWKCVFPPEDYIEQIFALAEKYFPDNTLILNEATGASFGEFRGTFGGYYLLLEKLIKKGLKIDNIGLQCHCFNDKYYKNIFNSERLYKLLDGYSNLGKPLVVSEISISEADEEIQALAVERLYSVCFSHESVNGIFWWNLDDNGILTDKNRNAAGENLPCGGLCRNGKEKSSYKVLDRLINKDWHTEGKQNTVNGKLDFNGFYGMYEIIVMTDGKQNTFNADFCKNKDKNIVLEL